MDIFWLYLFTKADGIQTLFQMSAFLLGIICFVLGFVWLMAVGDDDTTKKDQEVAESAATLGKKVFIPFVILGTIGLLLPSQKDLGIIIGGHFIYKGVTTEEFQDGLSDTYKKLYTYIQNELEPNSDKICEGDNEKN